MVSYEYLFTQSCVSHVRPIPLSKSVLRYQSFLWRVSVLNQVMSAIVKSDDCARYATQQHFSLCYWSFCSNFLYHFIFLGKFVSSCTYKAVGDNVVIRLGDEKLPQDSHLIWTHDKRRVYSKKGSNVKNEGLIINHYGSLILENIQKSKSGEYKAEVFDKDGKLIKKTVEKICVLGTY